MLDEKVRAVGPLDASQLTADINEELTELYKRSCAEITGLSGTNTLTGATNPVRSVLKQGMGFWFKAIATNTTAMTLDGLPLLNAAGGALAAGQVALDTVYMLLAVGSPDVTEYRIVNQLSAAKAPVVRTYIATTTWTKPDGLSHIKLIQQAAGAGGTQSSSGISWGRGGGDGAYLEVIIPAADLPASVSFTVGLGGASGVNGGDSSFLTYVCQGGRTSGGTAKPSSGDLRLKGRSGDAAAAGVASGAGSDSFLGRGEAGTPVSNATGVDGTTGSGASGGGNSSGGSVKLGGRGGDGLTIIEEYFA